MKLSCTLNLSEAFTAHKHNASQSQTLKVYTQHMASLEPTRHRTLNSRLPPRGHPLLRHPPAHPLPLLYTAPASAKPLRRMPSMSAAGQLRPLLPAPAHLHLAPRPLLLSSSTFPTSPPSQPLRLFLDASALHLVDPTAAGNAHIVPRTSPEHRQLRPGPSSPS